MKIIDLKKTIFDDFLSNLLNQKNPNKLCSKSVVILIFMYVQLKLCTIF